MLKLFFADDQIFVKSPTLPHRQDHPDSDSGDCLAAGFGCLGPGTIDAIVGDVGNYPYMVQDSTLSSIRYKVKKFICDVINNR